MKNKGMCQVLHVGRSNPRQQQAGKQLGSKGPGAPQAEHDPAVCPTAKKADGVLSAASAKAGPAGQ